MQQWYILLLLVQNDTWISIQSQCKTLRDRAGSGKFFSFYDFDCRASYTGEDVTVERPFYYFFFRWIKIFIVSLEGTATNLAIWLVLYPVCIFLSLPTGHGNAFVSRRVHPNFRCHFFINIPRFPAGQYF